jgi:hypothetical protein
VRRTGRIARSINAVNGSLLVRFGPNEWAGRAIVELTTELFSERACHPDTWCREDRIHGNGAAVAKANSR